MQQLTEELMDDNTDEELLEAQTELLLELHENPIDLNHADRDTLMQLPGVGERRALDIMARRTKHPFRHKRDITRIKGIGPKTYARMKDRLCDP